MKHHRIISLAVIGSAMLLAAACVEEIPSNEELYRPIGTPIVFSATTSYSNAPETRAEYSGDFFNGDTPSSTVAAIERIYWESGDKIRIVHNGTTAANYTVASGTNNTGERNSVATLTQGDLLWDGAESHTFYGLYPCVGTSVTSTTGGLTNNGTVSGTIPAAQDINPSNTLSVTEGGVTYSKYRPDTDKYGYMAAYKQVPANSGETDVVLPFRPAFTCFEFKLQRTGTENPAISSFELKTVEVNGSTTPLTGGFSLQINGGDQYGATWNAPTITNGGYSITVGGFGAGGVHIPTTGYLDFSVLALPINLTGVELVVHYTTNETKTLKFMNGGTWHTFTGAKKYIITNTAVPDAEWVYVIEEIPDQEYYGHGTQEGEVFNVKSYKYNKLVGPSVKVAVPWHLEYSTTGNAGSYSTTNSNADYGLHSGSTATGNGVNTNTYSTGELRQADIIRPNSNHNIDHPSAGQAARDALSHATPRGTSSAPFDLSKHPVYGSIDTEYAGGVVKTANCYVVSAPGYYKFPIVYGNAINGTSGNPTAANLSAYDPYGSGAPLASTWTTYASRDTVYMTEHFRNAIDEAITSPYIFNDFTSVTNYDAVVVWQDTDAGDEIIKYGTDDLKVVGSGSSAYIQFYIDPANIKQGNVVIAFRGQPNGKSKKILWSWHIWVTERDLSPVSSRDFMPVNLGWVDLTDAAVDKYTDRINHFRIVQDVPAGVTGDTEDFYIKQIGDIEQIKSNVGGNPFYQWGRKDPITPQSAKRTSDAYTSLPGATYIETYLNSVPYNDGTTNWAPLHQSKYDRGITEPYLPLADPTTHSWICGQFYPPISAFAHTSLGRGYNNGVLVDITNWVEINANQHIHSGVDADRCRQVASCVYNLWNASVWKSDDFGGSNKYKTVYDPCPPGFCVPTLDSFYGISATEDPSGDGMNFNISGTTVFFPYSGARVFHGDAQGSNTYENDTYRNSGFYWTDTPSQTGKSNSYDPNTGTNNTWMGWWWYQFGKSLRFSKPNKIDYVPEDNHWGAQNQTQRKGFDDVRANAFSVRPIADPKYGYTPSASSTGAPNGSINPLENYNNIPTE